MSNRQSFANGVLTGLGVGTQADNIDVLVSVMVGEGTDAEWNPCATEEKEPGDSDFNKAGVKDYESEAEGIAATVATLRDGNFSAELVLLGQGTNPDAAITAWAMGKWGTFRDAEGKPDVALALKVLKSVQDDRPAAYAVPVEGPEPVEPAAPAQTVAPIPVSTNAAESSATPPAPPSTEIPILEIGSKGGAVQTLQFVLNVKFNAEPKLTVDADFGPVTESMVKTFQTAHALAVDGVVGPVTWGALVNLGVI